MLKAVFRKGKHTIYMETKFLKSEVKTRCQRFLLLIFISNAHSYFDPVLYFLLSPSQNKSMGAKIEIALIKSLGPYSLTGILVCADISFGLNLSVFPFKHLWKCSIFSKAFH